MGRGTESLSRALELLQKNGAAEQSRALKTRLQISHLPPSVNHMYRHTKRGTFRTAAYVGWAAAVGHQVNRQMTGQPRWTGPVYVTVAMRCPRANSDIDNRLKGLGDLLQTHGVIANDKHIHGWNAFWSETLPEGVAAEISITPANSVMEKAA